MTLGLDVGTTGLRSVYRKQKSLFARKVLTSYLALPEHSPVRHQLDRHGVSYFRCDGSLILSGPEAIEWSSITRVPLNPVFPEGKIPTSDPVGRQMAASLIQSVIPASVTHAVIVVPGNRSSMPRDPGSLFRFTEQLLGLQGIKVLPLHAATAAALTTLGHTGFNGSVLNFGATSVGFSMVRNGRPLVELTHSGGMRDVDVKFARSGGPLPHDEFGNPYLPLEQIAQWREQSQPDLASPRTSDEERLADLVREWLRVSCTSLCSELAQQPELRHAHDLGTLVLTGGPVNLPGFGQLAEKALRDCQWPIHTTSVQCHASSPFVVARGCLIAAELEVQHSKLAA